MLRIWKWLQARFHAPIVFPVKSYTYKPGMPLWQCNLQTGEIVKAVFEETHSVDFSGKKSVARKLIMNENCLYEFAMNGENATKKFEKRIVEFFNTKKDEKK